MTEEQEIIEELEEIKTNFQKQLSSVLSERDQKIAAILKKENEEKRHKLSSELSS